MTGKPDSDILRRLSRGEASAYESLFERYHSKVRRFVAAITGDDAPAEDIAQNVFMKIWLNRSELERVNSLNNYLFTIARNEACDFLRKQASRYKYAGAHRDDPAEDSYRFALNYDLERIEGIVSRCVEEMPSQRRLVYKMSREEKLTSAEIAEKLHLSKRTVDRHISLALSDIRTALGNIVSGLAFFFISNWV